MILQVSNTSKAPPMPHRTVSWILPWRGRGNVIAAAGVALLDFLERA